MNYQEFREGFCRNLATDTQSGEHDGLVPAHIQQRWTRRFWRVSQQPASEQARLLNRFKLGADPEFYMRTSAGNLYAQNYNFRAALAFGADNNGRLCELRPMPSRSALAVTASCASTLRWLHWLRPDLAEVELRAGGWNGQDGIGGHVHFGRKRPTTPREISALDTLTFYLYHAGVLDQEGGRARYTRTNTYGRLGDVRQQFHGWEYRTMPSWLDSPWLAFACLTLSKLAVLDPELLPIMRPAMELLTRAQILTRLKGLLAYFQHLDDDAALAYAIWSRHGAPSFNLTDFRPRWGLFAPPPIQRQITVIPGMIRPLPEEVKELRVALLEARAPDPVALEPSWSPSTLPSSAYLYLPTETETYHSPGLGELVVGLCTHNRQHANCSLIGRKSNDIYVSNSLVRRLPADWKAISAKILGPDINLQTFDNRSWHIQFASGLEWRTHTRNLRRWLTSGLFPIWHVREVSESSAGDWAKRTDGLVRAMPPAPAQPATQHSKLL